MLCRRACRILRPAVCSCRALSSPRLDEAERRLQLLYGQDFRATRPEQLYPSHVRTTPVQKLGIACQAALTALRDPHRADMVAALGDAKMLTDPADIAEIAAGGLPKDVWPHGTSEARVCARCESRRLGSKMSAGLVEEL